MCGRYAAFLPAEAVARLFHTENSLPNVAASWNVAPSQDAMVVRRHPETGARHLDLLKWGLGTALDESPGADATPDQRQGGDRGNQRHVPLRLRAAALHRPGRRVL